MRDGAQLVLHRSPSSQAGMQKQVRKPHFPPLECSARRLVMVARDAPEILPHFIPSLGPAPPWAAFLEGLTDELEEAAAPTVYDDYR